MKIVKNAENETSIWVNFWPFLGPFKATKQLLGVCKMARGVPLISKNAQDIILVQYKSKYWAKMGQKLMKMVKNAENETSIWVI